MSFEDRILRKIDNDKRAHDRAMRLDPRRESVEAIEKAHGRAHEVLQNPAYAVQATKFVDLYGKENVLADMRRVKEKQKEIEKNDTPSKIETRRAAEVFEAIVLEQSRTRGWLGHNVAVFKTSRFDDYFNACDLIAEWTDERKDSRVLSLSVDVTFGARVVEKKLQEIRRRIDKGEMGTIKYFKSGDGTMRGERRMVPQIVVGADRRTVANLAQLWLQNNDRALATHPIQTALTEEIREQLDLGEMYAVSRGQRAVADAYARSRTTIEALMQEKQDVPLGGLEKDSVYSEILSKTKHVFQI